MLRGVAAIIGGGTAKQTALAALRAAGIIGAAGGLDTLQVAEATGMVDWAGNLTPTPIAGIPFTAYKGYGPGDSASQYVKSGYTPSVNGANYTLNDASEWIWCLTDAQSATYDAGNVAGSARTRLYTRDTNNIMAVIVNDLTGSTASGISESLGLFGAQRTGASAKKAWCNGVQKESTFSVASISVPTVELYYCGTNSGGFSTKKICMFAAGGSLSGKEAEFFNIMRNYFSSVKTIPYSIDVFGDSFTCDTAYGDLPSIANFHPALLNTALAAGGVRVNGKNFAVAGANSGARGTSLQVQVSGARTPVIPKYAGIYIGQNDNAAGFSSATSQANIVTAVTTLLSRGYAGIIIVGKHYDNLTSSADTISTQKSGNQTQRAFQAAAAPQIGGSAIYVDLYTYMRTLIVVGAYTQGDYAWHEGATDTHLNAIGEQIVADATQAAIESAGWISPLS